MKKAVLILTVLLSGVLFAQTQKNDINGTFEKCRANNKGFVTPEGWVKDKQSKGIKFSATTEEVRSGKFALYIEADAKALAHVYYHPSSVKAQTGDTIIFTVYGKGEGNFRIGVITYSDDGKNSFVRTLAAKGQKISDGEKWQKFTFTIPIGKLKRSGKEYTRVLLRPAVIINGEGEFVLDDLSYEIKGKTSK